ncbi:hypothetical protein EVAR_7682_1 [Eumeta japonica]|uniref:Uncharacterized protein n=1 Tax=Eumeta variegata TaxID=151549 RepID=A0A4C1TLS5_EUMVA|nr:hypothetical protein EVAR_7682_1 [Eumeta japonica]
MAGGGGSGRARRDRVDGTPPSKAAAKRFANYVIIQAFDPLSGRRRCAGPRPARATEIKTLSIVSEEPAEGRGGAPGVEY